MLYFVLALVFMLVVTVFAVQNALPVTVGFLYWSFETSLVIVILCAAIFGALAATSISVPVQIRLRWELRKARQRSGELETHNYMLKSKLELLDPQVTAKDGGAKD
ncbi:MAG: hypothetical protein H6Q73_525 [Firmicutes bacterium]|nr:hypothetical protein [Bacillota bacterium]